MKKWLQIPKNFLGWIRQHWKLSLFILLILVGVAVWQYRKNQAAIPQLKFSQVERTQLTEILSVSGVVEAKESANLRFAGGGKLTYLGAQEGDLVKKNQTLARVDARTMQKQLQQNLNTYLIQRLTFEQEAADRMEQLPSEELRREQQQEQARLNNSVLNVEIQDISIQNSVLSTPIGGVLVSSPASVAGTTLLASDAFQVINPESLVFRATVDQADVSKVTKTQTSEITLDAYPDEKIPSKVSFISFKSAQSSTGTVYIVEMPIQASGAADLSHFRLGMNGDASITLNQKNDVLAIPLSAVREDDGKTFVKIKTGENAAEDREITTGLETDTQIEVVSGLNQGDEIVVP